MATLYLFQNLMRHKEALMHVRMFDPGVLWSGMMEHIGADPSDLSPALIVGDTDDDAHRTVQNNGGKTVETKEPIKFFRFDTMALRDEVRERITKLRPPVLWSGMMEPAQVDGDPDHSPVLLVSDSVTAFMCANGGGTEIRDAEI